VAPEIRQAGSVTTSGCEDYRQLLFRLIGANGAAGLARSGLLAESADTERVASELATVWEAPAVDVMDIRVNGSRVDARVGSADGRAWLAVLWVTSGPSPVLCDASLYERPRPFEGKPPGTVIVLNGPSSVGKSSLISAFADAADTPWACLEEPWFGTVPTRFHAWPTTAGPRTEGFLAALGVAARVGNQFIVSAAGIPQDAFRTALRGVPTVYVGLDAPLDVLLSRQLTQPDKFGGLAEESVAIHEGWEYDLRVDTTSCSPTDAASQLVAFLVGRDP
jgi:chloramphenicol 3-O phosphotransferase